MSTPVDPGDIFRNTLLVLCAAMPQATGLRRTENDLTVMLRASAFGTTDAPLSPAGQQASLAASRYDDSLLSIVPGYAASSDGRRALEIAIYLHDAKGKGGECVFLMDYFDVRAPHNDPAGGDEVRQFLPGPWCQHLETLAQRALAVLEARGDGHTDEEVSPP
jgi:hypothetical protein